MFHGFAPFNDFVDAYQKRLLFVANQSSPFSESSQKDQHTASHGKDAVLIWFSKDDVWI